MVRDVNLGVGGVNSGAYRLQSTNLRAGARPRPFWVRHLYGAWLQGLACDLLQPLHRLATGRQAEVSPAHANLPLRTNIEHDRSLRDESARGNRWKRSLDAPAQWLSDTTGHVHWSIVAPSRDAIGAGGMQKLACACPSFGAFCFGSRQQRIRPCSRRRRRGF